MAVSPGSVIGSAFVKIAPDASGFESSLLGGLSGPLSKAEGMFGGLGKVAGAAILGIGVPVVAIGAASVAMAAKFQTATTQLITGAGESTKNIDMIRQGLLNMAPAIGVGPTALANALYFVESAGYHGAAGLNVLQIAAEGAKVGNADMTVVADALTTALNAYHQPASDAAAVMNTLTAAVSLGKTHMQDLAGAMGAILPIAAALGVPLDQVSAAMATMTVQGTDASKASQSLRFLMAAMAGPTAAATKEFVGLGIGMSAIPGITKSTTDELTKLGLHTTDVSYTLTHHGLLAALTQITDAIGKQFPVGSAAYESALKGAVGGTRGLTAALELTGQNLSTFQGNLTTIDSKVKAAGSSVSGWALIQTTFAETVDRARAALDVFMIRVGTALLPILSSVVTSMTNTVIPALETFAAWFAKKGEPALVAFGGWVGANIAVPFLHIAQVVVPILIASFGFVIGKINDTKAVLIPMAAILATMWAVDKIHGWASAAASAVSGVFGKMGMTGGVTGGGLAGGLASVQKVWIVGSDVPMGGGGSPIPPAIGGAAPAGSTMGSGLLAAGGGGVLMIGAALVAGKIMAGLQQQAQIAADIAGVWSSEKTYVLSHLSQIQTYLVAQGKSQGDAAVETAALAAAVKSGAVQTPAQVAAFLANWKATTNAAGVTSQQVGEISLTATAAKSIIGLGFGMVGDNILLWESALQKAGVSGGVAAAAQDALSNFIKLHGPVTQTEMAGFQFAATATHASAASMSLDSAALSKFVSLHGPLTAMELKAYEDSITASKGNGLIVQADMAVLSKFISLHGPLTAQEFGIFNTAVTTTGGNATVISTVMGAVAAFVKIHGPLTTAQMLGVQNNLTHSDTSAADITIALQYMNVALSAAVPYAQTYLRMIKLGASEATAIATARGLSGGGGYSAQSGGVANAGPTGQLWMLHNEEAIVPKTAAGWLWGPMMQAIATGKPPVFAPASPVPAGIMGRPSVPLGGGERSGPSSPAVMQTNYFPHSFSPAEMDGRIEIAHRKLVMALRAK
jgi:TP901 family phage tail tape measure protein